MEEGWGECVGSFPEAGDRIFLSCRTSGGQGDGASSKEVARLRKKVGQLARSLEGQSTGLCLTGGRTEW